MAAVAQVLYLIFTEGHTTTAGTGLLDVSLSRGGDPADPPTAPAAARDPEISGLLALMLLTDARRAARIGADGALVPLAEQDRGRWDREQIAEGIALVEAALPSGPVGPYQLQAAIAAVHAEAADAEQTDWAQIEALYRMLAGIAPGPVVTLNHAVARGHGGRPAPRAWRCSSRCWPTAGCATTTGCPPSGPTCWNWTGRSSGPGGIPAAARLATSIPEQHHLYSRAAAVGRMAWSSRGELMASDSQVAVSRRIEAPAVDIFAILADPRRHTELDGSGMLRGAVTATPVTGVGDVFVMRMYHQPWVTTR